MTSRGSTNVHLKKLISKLRKSKSKAFHAVAEKLEAPSRRRVSVNLWKIDKNTSSGDVAVVPGKVLSDGELTHKVTIAALGFSSGVLKKAGKNAELLSLNELADKKPSSKIVIIQ